MNPYPDHLADPRDPLPAEFGPELGRVDDAVGQAAGGAPLPAGLADRVFEASVARMPRPLLRPTTLRPAAKRWAGAAPVRSSRWSRLAMAASVALAFGVAGWLVRPPVPQESPENRRLLVASPTDDVLAPDVVWLLMQPAAENDPEVALLLDTEDMTFDDLAGELAMLVSRLEM